MLHNRRAFLLSTLGLTLAGCAATGAPWREATPSKLGMGLIYVYRPLSEENFKQGENPYVQVGTSLPVMVKPGGFVMLEVPEGIVTLRAFQNMLFVPTIPHIIDVEVTSSRPSYVRVEQSISKLSAKAGAVRAMQTLDIIEVDEDEALPEITETRAS